MAVLRDHEAGGQAHRWAVGCGAGLTDPGRTGAPDGPALVRPARQREASLSRGRPRPGPATLSRARPSARSGDFTTNAALGRVRRQWLAERLGTPIGQRRTHKFAQVRT